MTAMKGRASSLGTLQPPEGPQKQIQSTMQDGTSVSNRLESDSSNPIDSPVAPDDTSQNSSVLNSHANDLSNSNSFSFGNIDDDLFFSSNLACGVIPEEQNKSKSNENNLDNTLKSDKNNDNIIKDNSKEDTKRKSKTPTFSSSSKTVSTLSNRISTLKRRFSRNSENGEQKSKSRCCLL